MKRSPLLRRVGLSRAPLARVGLRRSRPRLRAATERSEAEIAWKTPRYGRCQNCGLLDYSDPLHGHHVIARAKLAFLGVDQFDPRDRMDLCPTCHMNHTYGQVNRKIAVEKLPEAALAFAVDVFGDEGLAAAYIHTHYRCETRL